MGRHGRAGFLIASVVSLATSDVRAFVSLPAAPASSPHEKLHLRNTGAHVAAPNPPHAATATTRNAATTAVATAAHRRARTPDTTSRATVCLASPFEYVDYDDDEVTRQEAEQLEDMIRGRRGIVVEAIEREWRAEMLKTLEDEGGRLCALAYDGFQTRGRGAVFVSGASRERAAERV